MSSARKLLEEYVANGRTMQLGTRVGDYPYVTTVWYEYGFRPDVLRWISRPDREHSRAIAERPQVGGAIVAIELDSLGQTVRGVSFTGRARQLPTVGVEEEIRAFATRWPAAASILDGLATGTTRSRLYEVAVEEWVLFDEKNFPGDPRQPIPGALTR